MGQSADVAARFDRISEVYDETRDRLSDEALDKLAGSLRNDGCASLLEVGVGTGRIAKPLLQRGFDITGADLSRRMMARAKQKGLRNLVMGDANGLPFLEMSFDGVILAHVIHLLDDPGVTFRKLWRIARNEMVVRVRKRERGEEGEMSWDVGGELREEFRNAAREMNQSIPPRPDWRGSIAKESEFVSASHPDEVITLEDVQIVTNLGERLSLLEKRAFGYDPVVSDEIFHELVERVRSRVDTSKEIRYRRVEEMAVWRLPITGAADRPLHP